MGPGTAIKNVLESFYITAGGCGCESIAQAMDKDGPDGVETKIDSYISQMKESIKNWRKTNNSLIPQPPDFTIRELILYGIRKSRESLSSLK